MHCQISLQKVFQLTLTVHQNVCFPLSLLLTHTSISYYFFKNIKFVSVQCSSVAQSCPTLCDPMNLSTPGLPVHYQLPEFTQTHVH